MPSQFVQIGQIVAAFGIRGQVKVKPLTDFLDRFEKGSRLRLQGDWVEVEDMREHGNSIVLGLNSVKDRTQAEALQWEYLEAPAEERPDLEEDEFFTSDLIGLKVRTAAGKELGVVDDVMAAPAQDILVIGEVMIPAVKQFVKNVDLKAGVITVELIPGMLPGEE